MASRIVEAITHSRLETGGDHHGFRYEVASDILRSGYDLGNFRSIDQEHTFYSDAGEYLYEEVGRHIHQGGCGTASSAYLCGIRQAHPTYFQILEEVP